MYNFFSHSYLSTDLKSSYTTDSSIQAIIQTIQLGNDVPKGFTLYNGLLFYRGRL